MANRLISGKWIRLNPQFQQSEHLVMLRKTYLKENFKVQYSLMLRNDTLWPHLLEVDQQAHEMMATIADVLPGKNSE